LLWNRVKAAVRPEICPYCFEPFMLRDTPFRCSSLPAACSPEKDDVLARKWSESLPVGRVIDPPRSLALGVARSARCANCGGETQHRLCPSCHMTLPTTTGTLRNYIFAVIGAKEAGKSHFIAVLIDHWRRHLGPDLDILLSPLNDHTIDRYRNDFYDPIFKKKTVIVGTVSAQTNLSVRMPLVYTLTFSGRGLAGRSKIKNAVTLVFFDTAGEDLNSNDVLSTLNKYIYRSDGIILLLDPLQISHVRDKLQESAALPQQNTETSDIITRTTELIRNGRKISPKSRVPIPLAVAFSKFDAVQPLVDAQYQINASADHSGGFDVDDFEAVHTEMEALIAEWQGEDVLQQVRTQYETYAFFGLSALGCNPHGDQHVPRVVPQRVEDPFLWLLHTHGLVKGVKRS